MNITSWTEQNLLWPTDPYPPMKSKSWFCFLGEIGTWSCVVSSIFIIYSFSLSSESVKILSYFYHSLCQWFNGWIHWKRWRCTDFQNVFPWETRSINHVLWVFIFFHVDPYRCNLFPKLYMCESHIFFVLLICHTT